MSAEMQQQLVAYARQIAKYRGYDNLVSGLQPIAVLQAKYDHECDEFAEAVASGDVLHVLHEAADMLYYAACLDEQHNTRSRYEEALVDILNAVREHHFSIERWHVEQGALLKYKYRASRPNSKDEQHELELMRRALAGIA